MPYMHWRSVREQQLELRIRFNPAAGRLDDHRDDHPRRSLDEAGNRYHTYASLAQRNDDQVVTRYLRQKPYEKNESQLKLIVVDQLWMWILDEGNRHLIEANEQGQFSYQILKIIQTRS